MAQEGQCGGSRVTSECVLEGGEVCALKCRDELIAEGSVDITIFVVFSTLFCVLSDEHLLVKGGFQRRGGGRLTGVGRADEGELTDERVLCHRQDDPEVAVLAPNAGTLD